MTFDIVAAICFGVVAGYVTSRSLYRSGEPVSLSSIAAVTTAVGGGAFAAALGDGALAWYSFGLAAGFSGSLVLRIIPAERSWLDDIVGLGGRFSGWALAGVIGGAVAGLALGNQLIGSEVGGLGGMLLGILLPRMFATGVFHRRGDVSITLDGSGSHLRIEHLDSRDLETLVRRLGVDVDRLERAEPRTAQIESRYADVHLFDGQGTREFTRWDSLRPSEYVTLRLSIGKLAPGSLLRDPVAFPADKVPPDARIDVMVSSTDFIVSADPLEPKQSTTPGLGAPAHNWFTLPGDGSAAKAPNGEEYIWIYLKAPNRRTMQARCRIGYYYRSILVHSQLLQAAVGEGGGIVVDTDFTISRDLTNLASLPEKPRISVLTNSNGDGTRQIILRKPGATPGAGADGASFAVNEQTIGATIQALRDALRRNPTTARQRSPAQLRDDLFALAPKGFELWGQVPGQDPRMFLPVIEDPEAFIVQISRPTTSGFVFPWALVYDIPLTSDTPDRPAKRKYCRLVAEWDGKAPLVQGSPRRCPHEQEHGQDVLCPFGFWGFRYSIDQISSTRKEDDTVTDIGVPDKWDFIVGETQYGLDDKAALAQHIERLGGMVRGAFPRASLSEGKDKKSIQALLGQDTPFVYFYCHGEKTSIADRNVRLGVGNQESITPLEFRGWLQGWLTQQRKVVWDRTRPLIFINACSSLEIYPETLVSFVDAFVGSARAAGVIGTEIQVNQYLAMEVAESFFKGLMAVPKVGEKTPTVESVLRTIRFDYLAHGNLLGLMYTPYCWSELHLRR